MAPKPLSRMVSFRLTTEEYDRFQRLCVARGLRNVSELVRAAISRMADDSGASAIAPPSEDIHARIASLESSLLDLTSSLAEMASRMNYQPNSTGDMHLTRGAQ